MIAFIGVYPEDTPHLFHRAVSSGGHAVVQDDLDDLLHSGHSDPFTLLDSHLHWYPRLIIHITTSERPPYSTTRPMISASAYVSRNLASIASARSPAIEMSIPPAVCGS